MIEVVKCLGMESEKTHCLRELFQNKLMRGEERRGKGG